MTGDELIGPIILGVVEGLTEFIPVSSTGHLILAEHVVGYAGRQARLLDVVIQVGAILAICWLYRRELWRVAISWPSDQSSRSFIARIAVATIPAAVVGALAHDFITTVLFSPWVVSISLILGGVAILIIERARAKTSGAASIGLGGAFGIGLCQLLSMIPGMSRSGATIMGAVALGVDRRTATEFSFFLAIPTMFGAAGLDLYKNRATIHSDDLLAIAIGFGVSFIVALVVVRWLVRFVGKHGFGVFAWYRIAAGIIALIILATAQHSPLVITA